MNLLQSAINALSVFMRSNIHAFERATCEPEKEQERVLKEILRRNEDTVFGRTFGFDSIASVADFQRRVPINDYDALFPYIQRAMAGSKAELTASPIEMFASTSGTTSAVKLIPVTRESICAQKEASDVWTMATLGDYPKIVGRVLTIASRRVEGYTEGGIPFGAISGLMHEKQGVLAKLFYVSKTPMFEIDGPDAKYYVVARAGLENDLTHIHTANPSTVIKICHTIEQNAERLIRDIHDGTISAELPREIAERIATRPNRKRARQLERIASLGVESGGFAPMNYWPNLVLVGCWKGGTQNLFLERFPRYFGNVPVRDIGLLASEGRMTIPLSDNGSSGVLDINHSFFEFVPEQEIDNPNPEVLTASQIREGERYFIIMTNTAGLYRYNISDLVEVTGRHNQTPEVAFLNKGSHISSIVGEKLTEHQVVNAYGRSKTPDMPDRFILYPHQHDGEVRYVLLTDFNVGQEFLDRFEGELRHGNVEYDSKVKTGRMKPVVVKQIAREKLEKLGMKNPGSAQCKFVYLKPQPDFYQD